MSSASDANGADSTSWHAEFESMNSASAHKLWKQQRLIRQEEKRCISNYLRSILHDSAFVSAFTQRERCVRWLVDLKPFL